MLQQPKQTTRSGNEDRGSIKIAHLLNQEVLSVIRLQLRRKYANLETFATEASKNFKRMRKKATLLTQSCKRF
jgi:hypothetical protein